MLARPSGLAYVAGSMWLGPCACACSSDTCAPQQQSIECGKRNCHSCTPARMTVSNIEKLLEESRPATRCLQCIAARALVTK
jgi:hypothetical protein